VKWYDKLIVAISICFVAGAGVYAYGLSKSGREWMAIHNMISSCKGSWSIYGSKMNDQTTWGRFKCERQK